MQGRWSVAVLYVKTVTSHPVATGPKGRVIKEWLCLSHIGVIQRCALVFFNFNPQNKYPQSRVQALY